MAQPDLIPMPFAENATPGTIEPIEATTPTVPQDATWSTGFPQVTMQPLASGGIPPRGQNFNGVLNALSQHIFYMQGGGQYKWSADHGPYSIGDVLQSDDGLRSYVSAVDNNTDNFNTTPSAIGGTWLPWSGVEASELIAGLIKIATTAQAQSLTADNVALTPAKLAAAFGGANHGIADSGYQKLPGGLIIQWTSVTTSAAGNVTFTFPIAFPNAIFRTYGTLNNPGGVNATVGVAGSGVNGGIAFAYNAQDSTRAVLAVNIIAIGH